MIKSEMVSIWFLIGLLLTAYGVLILGSGVYEWMNPSPTTVVLANLHPAVWWGAVTLALGVFYVVWFRPGKKG